MYIQKLKRIFTNGKAAHHLSNRTQAELKLQSWNGEKKGSRKGQITRMSKSNSSGKWNLASKCTCTSLRVPHTRRNVFIPDYYYRIPVQIESMKSLGWERQPSKRVWCCLGFCRSWALSLWPQCIHFNSSEQAVSEQSASPGLEPKGLSSNLGNMKIPVVLSQSDRKADTHC